MLLFGLSIGIQAIEDIQIFLLKTAEVFIGPLLLLDRPPNLLEDLLSLHRIVLWDVIKQPE